MIENRPRINRQRKPTAAPAPPGIPRITRLTALAIKFQDTVDRGEVREYADPAGPAPEVIRQIAKHEFFDVNSSFSMTRGQDQNAAAKLLLFEYAGGLGETEKVNLDMFVNEAAQQPPGKVELAGRKVVDVLDEMQEIFLPKDRLLVSAGQVPVYYWFVRSRPNKDSPDIREFLVRFEEQRRDNRLRVKQNPKDRKIDRQFVEYDQVNRNTNDLASHEGRFSILKQRFKSFVRRDRGDARAGT